MDGWTAQHAAEDVVELSTYQDKEIAGEGPGGLRFGLISTVQSL